MDHLIKKGGKIISAVLFGKAVQSNIHATGHIITSARQDIGAVGAPLNFPHCIFVSLKVKFANSSQAGIVRAKLYVSTIPDLDGFVNASRRQNPWAILVPIE